MNTWQFHPASAFPEFAGPWDALNARLHRSHPLFDSRFVSALVRHFGTPEVVLAVYPGPDGQPVNMLLLQPAKTAAWTTFLPSQTQVAPILCGEPAALPALFGALPGSVLMLDFLCQDPEYTFVAAPSPRMARMKHATTVNIDMSLGFEPYWQQRPKSFRQNIRTCRNRLEKQGHKAEVKVFSAPEGMRAALRRYGDIESASWKGQEGTAIHIDNMQGRFYADVLEAFATTGQAEVIEYLIDGKTTASRICLLNPVMLITLKTCFDDAYATFSPSELMLQDMLEKEYALRRIHFVEMYTNAKPSQFRWCTGQRDIDHLTMYRSEILPRALSLAKWLKGRLA